MAFWVSQGSAKMPRGLPRGASLSRNSVWLIKGTALQLNSYQETRNKMDTLAHALYGATLFSKSGFAG